MDYSLKTSELKNIKCDALIVFAFKDNLDSQASELDQALDGRLSSQLLQSGLNKKSSGFTIVYDSGIKSIASIVLVQLGSRSDLSLSTVYNRINTAVAQLAQKPLSNLVLSLTDCKPDNTETHTLLHTAVRACENTQYNYHATKKSAKSKSSLKKIILHDRNSRVTQALKTAIEQGKAISQGESYCKELGNLPGNICTPSYLADQAKALAKSHKIKVKVLDEKKIQQLGMGALLSVSKGSDEPAKLIIMEYNGSKDKNSAPAVLVGKGLTFDAGGISIKPAAKMDEMKYDMCGGASVFGTMKAIAEMKLPINLIGVVPSSENLINGQANKPGDVVTSLSKQTIEILNTDAEGRLILCDALTYVERYKPAFVVDIATLTGAVIVALGDKASGLMANDDGLAQQINSAGQTCGDRVWQLPIWDEYQSQLNSNFADMANVGGRSAGTITAACFLSRFAKKFRWAHLDIAGTAWLGGAKKGATGRPVPLLCQLLMNHAEKSI